MLKEMWWRKISRALYSITGNQPATNALDISDVVIKALNRLSAYKEGANDGIVSMCIAKFGKTIRDNYPWNHLDEINLMFGIKGAFVPDPVNAYRQHANRLELQGL